MSRILPQTGLVGPLLTTGATILFALGGCSDKAEGLEGAVGGSAGAGKGGAAAAGKSSAGAPASAGNSATAGRGSGGSAGSANATGGTGGGAGGPAGGSNGGAGGKAAAGGGAGRGGSGGNAGGRGGASGAGGAAGDAAGAPDNGGAPSGSGCTGRLICEDFESTDTGDVPAGWTRHGDLAAVDDGDAHGGSHALKLSPAANSERRIYHDASVLGAEHWGRIFYKVELPVPDAFVHSTMVSLIGDGPQNGRSDYRPIDVIKQAKDTPDVGGRHNFIYNVQIIGSSEFGTETNYDYNFDAMWHCAEYHIQASNQSYTLYLDGEEILSFQNGAGNYDDSDIPDSFDEVRVGSINYQNAPPGFTAWIDDVAFDDERIGCD